MRMTRDKVLIKQVALEKETEGGIILAESTELKADPRGTVMAVGPEVKDLEAGDQVVFGTYAGTLLTVDGDECLILREEDVLAKETA